MEHKVLEVTLLKAFRDGNFQYPFLKSVIDADKFNAVTGSSIHVDKRCYIRLNQSGVDSDHDENKLDTMDINLISGEISGNFKFQESVNGINFNRLELFSMDNIILMNSEDYNGFKSKVGDSELEKVHLINFKNWKNSRSTVRKLNDGLKAWNKTTPESSFIKEYGGGRTEEELLKVSSRIESYISQRQGTSLQLFICSLLGLFFYIASTIMLSFKLFSEIDEEKEEYRRLYHNIGIKDTEVKKAIYQELGVEFFLPVVVGAFLSFVYTSAFTTDAGELARSGSLICNIGVSLVYLTFLFSNIGIEHRTIKYHIKIVRVNNLTIVFLLPVMYNNVTG
ncbi:MAG: hypothetical protein Q8930_09845 [Bacillota bacterium]|nr:hypothetical protein [Bacillota bacterium]